MDPVRLQMTIDCADPHRMAAFWSGALGYTVEFDDPANAWGAVVDAAGTGPRVVFQRVPEPKAGKAGAHLDLQVGQAGLAAALPRITALGARVLRNLVLDPDSRTFHDSPGLHDTAPAPWRRFILADVEGNEFCLQ